MNIKNRLSALVGTAAIVILSGAAGAAWAQSNGPQYGDDPIVRDLKAGKLSVHQAQVLQERRTRADTATARHSSAKNSSAQKKHNGRAPIRQLTAPHAKKKNAKQLKKRHGSSGKPVPHKHKAHTRLDTRSPSGHDQIAHKHTHHIKQAA